MARPIDITGQRYGRLVAIRYEYSFNRKRYWSFNCDCGVTKTIALAQVRVGTTVSCGCYQKEYATSEEKRLKHTTHGMTKSQEWEGWVNAKERCYSPSGNRFQNYGGRGIRVCEEWLDDFQAFYDHIGPCPDGYSLDRIDVDGDYEPGNVKWSTPEEQSQNRTSTKLTAEIVRYIRQSNESNKALAEQYGVNSTAIWSARTGRTWANIT